MVTEFMLSARNSIPPSACINVANNSSVNVRKAPNINGPLILNTNPKLNGSKPMHFNRNRLKLKMSASRKVDILCVCVNYT